MDQDKNTEKDTKMISLWNKCKNMVAKALFGDDSVSFQDVVVVDVNTISNTQQPQLTPVGKEEDIDKDVIETVKSSHNEGRLVKETAKLIRECDKYASESEDGLIKSLYEDFANKLIENLILSGCEAINPKEGDSYNYIYHLPNPFSMLDEALIDSTIRLGVQANNGEVLVRAIVKLK